MSEASKNTKDLREESFIIFENLERLMLKKGKKKICIDFYNQNLRLILKIGQQEGQSILISKEE